MSPCGTDEQTTSEDRATQLLTCETLSLAICAGSGKVCPWHKGVTPNPQTCFLLKKEKFGLQTRADIILKLQKKNVIKSILQMGRGY